MEDRIMILYEKLVRRFGFPKKIRKTFETKFIFTDASHNFSCLGIITGLYIGSNMSDFHTSIPNIVLVYDDIGGQFFYKDTIKNVCIPGTLKIL